MKVLGASGIAMIAIFVVISAVIVLLFYLLPSIYALIVD